MPVLVLQQGPYRQDHDRGGGGGELRTILFKTPLPVHEHNFLYSACAGGVYG